MQTEPTKPSQTTATINVPVVSAPSANQPRANIAKAAFAPVKKAGVIITKVDPRVVSTRFFEFFQWLFLWIALNVVPIIALFGLLALAVVGTFALLGNNLNHDQRLLGSVFVVGVVASLAFINHKRQGS